jgi:hypothetical protein
VAARGSGAAVATCGVARRLFVARAFGLRRGRVMDSARGQGVLEPAGGATGATTGRKVTARERGAGTVVGRAAYGGEGRGDSQANGVCHGRGQRLRLRSGRGVAATRWWSGAGVELDPPTYKEEPEGGGGTTRESVAAWGDAGLVTGKARTRHFDVRPKGELSKGPAGTGSGREIARHRQKPQGTSR